MHAYQNKEKMDIYDTLPTQWSQFFLKIPTVLKWSTSPVLYHSLNLCKFLFKSIRDIFHSYSNLNTIPQKPGIRNADLAQIKENYMKIKQEKGAQLILQYLQLPFREISPAKLTTYRASKLQI